MHVASHVTCETANPIGNSTNNEWLICWTADASPPTSLDVFARRMLADGTLMPEFAVKADAAKISGGTETVVASSITIADATQRVRL